MASVINEPLEQQQVYDTALNQCGVPEQKTTVQTHDAYAQEVTLGKNEVTYNVKELEPDELSTKLHTQDSSSSTEQTEAPLSDEESTHSTQIEVPSPDKETTTTKKKKKKKKKKNITDKDVVKSGATAATSGATIEGSTQASLNAADKRRLIQAARKAKKTTARQEQDKTSKIVSTENPALVVSDAEREKMRKVARQPKKASCEKVVNPCTSSPQHIVSCTETKIRPSIEGQKRQELHCKLNALIRSKRQTSLATNNWEVLRFVFPNDFVFLLLASNEKKCGELLKRAKEIFAGEDKRFKVNHKILNQFKHDLMEATTIQKDIHEEFLKPLLNHSLQLKLQKVFNESAETRIVYQELLFMHHQLLDALFLFFEIIDNYDDIQTLHSDKTTDTGKITEPSQVPHYFKLQIDLGANLCWCLNAKDEIQRLANSVQTKTTQYLGTSCDLDEKIVEQYQRHLENCITEYRYSCSKVEQCPEYEDKKQELNEILRSQLDIFTDFKGSCLSHNPQYTQCTTQQIVGIIKLNYNICVIYFTTWNLVMLPSALKTLDAEFTSLQECLCANTSGAVSCSSADAKPNADMNILSDHFDFFYSKFDLVRLFLKKNNQKYMFQLVPKAQVAKSDEIQQERLILSDISYCIQESFNSGFFNWLYKQLRCGKNKTESENKRNIAESPVVKEGDDKSIERLETRIKIMEEEENQCLLRLQKFEAETRSLKAILLNSLTPSEVKHSWNIEELIATLTPDEVVPSEVCQCVEQLECQFKKEQAERQNCFDETNCEAYANIQLFITAAKLFLERCEQQEKDGQELFNNIENTKKLKASLKQITQSNKASEIKASEITASEIIEDVKHELFSLLKEFETLKDQHEKFKKQLEDEANKEAQMRLQALMKEIEQESETSKKVAPLPPPRLNSPECDDEPSMCQASTVEFAKPQDPTKAPNLIKDAAELITTEQLTTIVSKKKWADLPSVLRPIFQNQQRKNIQNVEEASVMIELITKSITEMSSEQYTHCKVIIELHQFIIEYIYDISSKSLTKMILYNRLIIQYKNKLEGALGNTSLKSPSKREDKEIRTLIKRLPEAFNYLEWLHKIGLSEITKSLGSIDKLKQTTSISADEFKCCFSFLKFKVSQIRDKLEKAKAWQYLNFQDLYKKRGEHIKQIKLRTTDSSKMRPKNRAPLLTQADTENAEEGLQVINSFIGKLDSSLQSADSYLKTVTQNFEDLAT